VKAAPRRSPGPYEQLGIRPVVNFQGTMTTLGASKMWEDLHEAAAQASREYVVLEELQEKIGSDCLRSSVRGRHGDYRSRRRDLPRNLRVADGKRHEQK
jgi:hypothetical protein